MQLFHKKVNSDSRREHRNEGHAYFSLKQSEKMVPFYYALSLLSSEFEKNLSAFFFPKEGEYFSLV